jgi:two-component system, cell cycle response regulator
VTATNVPDAIAICEKGGCDIVLLDVKMPGMNGFEVCRRLRSAPDTAHLPIVLLTALDRPADRVRVNTQSTSRTCVFQPLAPKSTEL